jgi:hypothetical protein
MQTDAVWCGVMHCDAEQRMATTTDEDESTVRTTVTIPKSSYSEIEKIARDKRVSVAWVVREAVAEYLAENVEVDTKASRKGARK